MFVGVDVLGDPQYTNFGKDIAFSADLCYNGMVEGYGQGKRVVEKKTNKAKKF